MSTTSIVPADANNASLLLGASCEVKLSPGNAFCHEKTGLMLSEAG